MLFWEGDCSWPVYCDYWWKARILKTTLHGASTWIDGMENLEKGLPLLNWDRVRTCCHQLYLNVPHPSNSKCTCSCGASSQWGPVVGHMNCKKDVVLAMIHQTIRHRVNISSTIWGYLGSSPLADSGQSNLSWWPFGSLTARYSYSAQITRR